MSFYPYPTLGQSLDNLKERFCGTSRLLLVLGDFGSGKTLMMKQFLAGESNLWKPCKVNPSDSGNDDEPMVSARTSRGYRAYIYSAGDKTALMMDDAQNLSVEDISFLIGLTGDADDGKQVDQVVLFAETSILQIVDELSELLSGEGDVDQVFMPRMSRLEADTYILKRLDSVHHKAGRLFTSSELDWIYDESGGYPGGINEAASRIFTQKTKDEGEGEGRFSTFLKKFF